MKISVGTSQLWKIYAKSSQQESAEDIVLFLSCFFNDSWPLAVLSVPPQIPKWGESRGRRKRGGSRLGMVIQGDKIFIQRDKMIIQRDKMVIQKDNFRGKVGADRDFRLGERSVRRNKIEDLTQQPELCWEGSESKISSNGWDQNIPGAAVPWIRSIPEQFGDRAKGSPRWGFVSVEQGWTLQNHLGVALGYMVALAVPGEGWDSMIRGFFQP